MLMLTLMGMAAAAESSCPGRVDADEYRALIERAGDALSNGDREVNDQLAYLADRIACVDGPLFDVDLGTLYLYRGIALYGDDKRRALDLLGWAAAMGASWPDDFGDSSVRGVYQELMTAVGDGGVMSVVTEGGADVLLLDGWVVEAGEHPVAVGAHLLQWRIDSQWYADWVVIEKDQTVAVGPELAQPSRAAAEAEGPTYGAVLAGMRAYRGTIYDGYREWSGNGVTPGLHMEGRLGLAGPWYTAAEAAIGSGASAERPPMISGASALGGLRFGDTAWVDLAAGPRGGVFPGVEPGVDSDDAPTFQENWRLGVQTHVGLGAVDGPVAVDLSLNGAWYGPAWETWAALSGGLRFETMEPLVRLSSGLMGIDAAWGRESRYDWYSVELGILWRLP